MDLLASHLARMRPQLLRRARRGLRNAYWAEEAVSETLLAALQRRPDFGDERRLRGWVFGILRHKVADQLRQHLGESGALLHLDLDTAEALQLDDPGPHADPVRCAGARQFITALHGELRRLPAAQAEAFVQRECLGHDAARICDELAISSGNLWVMLHRARHRLRQRLAAHA